MDSFLQYAQLLLISCVEFFSLFAFFFVGSSFFPLFLNLYLLEEFGADGVEILVIKGIGIVDLLILVNNFPVKREQLL